MKKKLFNGLVIVSAIIYVIVLYRLLFVGFGRANIALSEGMQRSFAYNLIPFKTIAEYLGTSGGHATMNLVGNLLVFLPLGFYLPFLFPRMTKIGYYMIFAALLIIAVEVTQLITMTGSLDIDDFILNFIGAMIGYAIFVLTPIRAIFKLRIFGGKESSES